MLLMLRLLLVMRMGFFLCVSLHSVHLGLCARSYAYALLTLWTYVPG